MKLLTLLALGVSLTQALPELSISKLNPHGLAAAEDSRRELSERNRRRAFDTTVFDVLRWSPGGAYYANITVGSPAQPQTVILDTGSSDLYFDASNSTSCTNPPENFPCLGGTFDRSRSATYRQLSSTPDEMFNTSFGDNSTAAGPYGADVVGIGSVSLTDVKFGVAEVINSTTGPPIGLLGLGYDVDEAAPRNERVLIPLFLPPAPMLTSTADLSGSILFGGVDTAKFTGPLTTLDFLPSLNEGTPNPIISDYVTTITSAELTVKGQNYPVWENGPDGIQAYSSDHSLPVVLDTGSTAWTVPSQFYKTIAGLLPGSCPCKTVDSSASLSLTFGGKARIQVPVTELYAPSFNIATGETEKDICSLLINNATRTRKGFWIAGDSILRSMYTVFDLDNGQVSIAQASTDISKPPNIVEVRAGPDGVAKAVSGVVTAPSNTWSIVSAPTGTLSVSAATLATPIGTATGVNAIPPEGQVVGTIPVIGSSVPSTFTTSITTPTSTPSIPASPSPGRGTCSKDGALVCNGPNEFGLCNFGQVIWQPVAPGTACKNDGIVGVGIYAVPE
ncbi:hypothetical protein PRZ48_009336 [Zasmidium cellare]|uniref:Peptidase A1 domain-containing protein n=1 Tax=Zasmidium cellare TaxID=395010 RepID=A0ABR0EBG0_ZASCE|nr:hypothetical protein PRZ48_009336 [Zasmidium cellare]